MRYIHSLDLPWLREMIIADSENEGELKYLIDGQRTPILYSSDGAESLALMASTPAPVQSVLDAYPDKFAIYSRLEVEGGKVHDMDTDGNPIYITDSEGIRSPVMINQDRTTDVYDLFRSTAPVTTVDAETGESITVTPPAIPLVIAM